MFYVQSSKTKLVLDPINPSVIESRDFQSVIKYARIEQRTIPNEPVKLAMTPIHERPLWKLGFKMTLERCTKFKNLENHPRSKNFH